VDTAAFRRQLDHIGRTYEAVSVLLVLATPRGDERLPENAAWRTFDDRYIDH
jgi:hypothetical protein